MTRRSLLALVVAGWLCGETPEASAQKLRALIATSPKLPLTAATIPIQLTEPGWGTDYISSVAAAKDGTYAILHRNLKTNPVVIIDPQGRIVRSWGKGLFTNPHSIRIDSAGNVWTVDSGSSVVLKFSPAGDPLLRFEVGELPQSKSGFRGATDIAFAPAGRIFVADGYGNARILEYDSKGRRVHEWGSPGNGPGQFRLPHSLTIFNGVLYVADRENGRIQRFALDGRYLGEWNHLGKTFSITTDSVGHLWLGSHPRNVPNEAPGWIMKIDRSSGKLLGYVDSPGLHSVALTAAGVLISDPGRGNPDRLQWFRTQDSH